MYHTMIQLSHVRLSVPFILEQPVAFPCILFLLTCFLLNPTLFYPLALSCILPGLAFKIQILRWLLLYPQRNFPGGQPDRDWLLEMGRWGFLFLNSVLVCLYKFLFWSHPPLHIHQVCFICLALPHGSIPYILYICIIVLWVLHFFCLTFCSLLQWLLKATSKLMESLQKYQDLFSLHHGIY